jgi:hypothetical protein
MKTSDLRFVSDGAEAVLFLRFRDEEVRCKVDTADVPLIQRECSTIHMFEPKPGVRYARVYTHGKQIGLHRFLLGMEPGDPRLGDHENTNTLDYRRKNLRAVPFATNCLNRRKAASHNQSGIRGIARHNGKWCAQLYSHSIGRFADIRDAVETVWLGLLAEDPVAATNFLRSLPTERTADMAA